MGCLSAGGAEASAESPGDGWQQARERDSLDVTSAGSRWWDLICGPEAPDHIGTLPESGCMSYPSLPYSLCPRQEEAGTLHS